MRPYEIEKMHGMEKDYWWFVSRRRLVGALIRKFGTDRPQILAVGCGTGGEMQALADVGSVTGIDISKDALDMCRTGGQTGLIQAHAADLPVADSSFDAVICADILEHLTDDIAALQETMRTLRPGGIAVITVPAHPWLWSQHDVALSHRRRYSKRQLRERLKESGAEILKLTYTVTFVFPIVIVFRILRKLNLQQTGLPHTQLMNIPDWANRLLTRLQDLENWLTCHFSLPPGTSLAAVIRKPENENA